eukprot:7382015-Prymnesium_polylepis.1
MGCTVSCTMRFPGGPEHPFATPPTQSPPKVAPHFCGGRSERSGSVTNGKASLMNRSNRSGRLAEEDYQRLRPRASTLAGVAHQKQIFDSHCHYVNYLQQTEGLAVLSNEMEEHGVGYAVLTGCAFKKCWVGSDQPPPQHHLYDDGDLYHYSGTDGLVTADIMSAYDEGGVDATRKFAVMACGFNLGDYG